MKSKSFLIAFLAVVGLIALLSIYLSTAINRTEKTVSAVVSPDKKFKAVRLTVTMQDKSYCFDSVSLMLAVYPDVFAEKNKEYQIYAAPCARFADGTRSPAIEWVSNSALRVIHVKPPAGTKEPRLRTLDVTRTVRVTFVEKE